MISPVVPLTYIFVLQELQFQGKRFNHLHWLRYQVVTLHASGNHQKADIDVTNGQMFPSMTFHRVRSFFAPESEAILP